jgi:hypothetical protein
MGFTSRSSSSAARACGAIAAVVLLTFPSPAFANMGYLGPGAFIVGDLDGWSWFTVGLYATMVLSVSGASLLGLRRLASKCRTQATSTVDDA